jgi:hypothetical protein
MTAPPPLVRLSGAGKIADMKRKTQARPRFVDRALLLALAAFLGCDQGADMFGENVIEYRGQAIKLSKRMEKGTFWFLKSRMSRFQPRPSQQFRDFKAEISQLRSALLETQMEVDRLRRWADRADKTLAPMRNPVPPEIDRGMMMNDRRGQGPAMCRWCCTAARIDLSE